MKLSECWLICRNRLKNGGFKNLTFSDSHFLVFLKGHVDKWQCEPVISAWTTRPPDHLTSKHYFKQRTTSIQTKNPSSSKSFEFCFDK